MIQDQQAMRYSDPKGSDGQVGPVLEGVLVEGELDGHKAACSGVIFGGGRFVLTQGALLTALKTQKLPSRQGELESPPDTDLHLTLVREHAGTTAVTLAAWWTCPLLCKAASDLYNQGWRFGPDDQGHEAMGLMLVLGVGFTPSLSEVRLALGHLLKDHVLPAGRPSTGSPVFLESTPFGSGSLFLNSWSSGVISSVTGSGNSLLLCDVHAAPGSEGGGLYTRSGMASGAHIVQDSGSDPRGDVLRPGAPRLVGLVVLPFSVVRGEAVALCLCAALAPVLAELLDLQPRVTLKPGPASGGGVAVLRHGSSWASAVCLDAARTIFVTCSHVLQGSGQTTLQWLGGGSPRSAEVVFRTSPGAAFDLAVVRTSGGGGPRAPPLARSPPLKGEAVLVSGYGVLAPPAAPGALPPPLVSRGCVSMCRPNMLQTSCCVQSGASGGAVLRPGSGELLGLVVGHMRAEDAEPLPRDWPRINFAVPMAAVGSTLREFLRTADAGVLQALESSDLAVQRLWRLDPQPASKL